MKAGFGLANERFPCVLERLILKMDISFKKGDYDETYDVILSQILPRHRALFATTL